MSKFVQLLRKKRDRKAKFFDHLQAYLNTIEDIVIEHVPNVRVQLFGSVSRDEHGPSSDIDILIYSPQMPQSQQARAQVSSALTKNLETSHPFEFHFVDDEQLEWYRQFDETLFEDVATN